MVGTVALALAATGAPAAGAAPRDPGRPVRIELGFPSFTGVRDVQVTPDGTRLLFLADADTNDMFELYSAPIAGGTPTKLSDALVDFGDVFDFALTPDGATVVYRATQDDFDQVELYAVPVTGGTSTKLNTTLQPPIGGVNFFAVSPDGASVAYLADAFTQDVLEIFVVPIGGGSSTKVSGSLGSGSAGLLRWTVDASTIVFVARLGAGEPVQLFSVPASGGILPTQLNPDLPEGATVSDFAGLTPSDAIYVADQVTDGVRELWRVPIGGGSATRLNPEFPSGGTVTSVRLSADATRVAFVADIGGDGQRELLAVAATGGPVATLVAPEVGEDVLEPTWTPDGSRVLYTIGDDDGVVNLGSVRATGGGQASLNRRLPLGGEVDDVVVDGQSQRVLYIADQQADQAFGAFSAPVAGGTAVQLNPPLGEDPVNGNDVRAAEFTPDGRTVILIADFDESQRYVLYRVRPAFRCDGRFSTISGTSAGDVLRGTRRPDVIVALGGDDDIDGRGGADRVCAGGGDDTVRGGNGGDRLFGGKGRDSLDGGKGADRCVGQVGRDTAARCETEVGIP